MALELIQRLQEKISPKKKTENFIEKKKKRREDRASAERSGTTLPKREPLPVFIHPKLKDLLNVPKDSPGWSEKRKQEILGLKEALANLPRKDFDQMREDEMDRLHTYYDAFTEVFGIDLWAVAMTRIQLTETIMISSLFLLQLLFEEDIQPEEDNEHVGPFKSTIVVEGMTFKANGTRFIGGMPVTFSVFKQRYHDEEGEFGVDYPVYSIPREVAAALQDWHNANFEGDLSTNPMISNGLEIVTRRVHDWLHAAILYDTNALTRQFKEWSDNSFMVKHFFKSDGMINYELLSNHMHFETYKHIFKNDPEAKKEIIAQIVQYSEQIEQWCEWLKTENNMSPDEAEKMANYMMNIVTRGIFDFIRYDDEDLNKAFVGSQRFATAKDGVLEEFQSYLDAVYTLNDKLIPFRRNSDEALQIAKILEEYVDGLQAESKEVRDLNSKDQLWRSEDHKEEAHKLPESIKVQLGNLNPAKFEPRIMGMINKRLEKLKSTYTEKICSVLIDRIEVDSEGLFYLKLDRKDLFTIPQDATDPDGGSHESIQKGGLKEVIQKKGALLIQVPYDEEKEITVTINRVKNLLNGQIGASAKVKAGDIIQINTQNEALAQNLLSQATDAETGRVNFEQLLLLADHYKQKGLVEFHDIYPTAPSIIAEVFALKGTDSIRKNNDDKWELKNGYYVTPENLRHAANIDGPISLDPDNKHNGGRRRVLSGVLVKNHIQEDSVDLDIFPVDAKSFGKLYPNADRSALNHLTVNDIFLITNGLKNDRDEFQNAMEELLDDLNAINMAKLHGSRGKPKLITFREFFAQGKSERKGSGGLLRRLRRN